MSTISVDMANTSRHPIPDHLRLKGDPGQEERELESSRDLASLQRYRWNTRDDAPIDIIGLLKVELELRENTQRKEALREIISISSSKEVIK